MGVEDHLKRTFGCTELCKGVEVPSRDEIEALEAMRIIKDRVRDLKKEISDLSPPNSDKSAQRKFELEKELARLKAEWNEWEVRRKEAARARMILLGHEEVS